MLLIELRQAGSIDDKSITLKIPRLGYQSVSDTWGLAKVVREVEFKLLQLNCSALVFGFVQVQNEGCPKSFRITGILVPT